MHKNIRKVIVGVSCLFLVGTMPIYAQKVCIGEKQVEVGKIELAKNSWHYIELGNIPQLIPGCKGYYSKDHQVIRVTDDYNSIVFVPLEPIAGKMGYEVTTNGGKVILRRQSGDYDIEARFCR